MRNVLTSVITFTLNAIILIGILVGMGTFTLGGAICAAQYNSGVYKTLVEWWFAVVGFILCWSLNLLLARELVRWVKDEIVPRFRRDRTEVARLITKAIKDGDYKVIDAGLHK